jgi:probable phosphoglycerate mutase
LKIKSSLLSSLENGYNTGKEFKRSSFLPEVNIMQHIWMFLFRIWLRWRFWRWRRTLLARFNNGDEKILKKKNVLLFRHGQTDWNLANRLPGQAAGVPLNATGRQQALDTGVALSVLPIHVLVSSPLERAQDTASLIADGQTKRPEIHLEDGLMDTDVGPWTNKLISELNNDPHWQAYVRDPRELAEGLVGVETFLQVQARAVEVIERWLPAVGEDEYIGFVAHGDVVKLILAHYMGWDIQRGKYLQIGNASVSFFQIAEDRSVWVQAINWVPRPGWLELPVKTSGEVKQEP